MRRVRIAAEIEYFALFGHGPNQQPNTDYTITRTDLMAALEHMYAAGYRDARSDAVQTIGCMVGEHEIYLDDVPTHTEVDVTFKEK